MSTAEPKATKSPTQWLIAGVIALIAGSAGIYASLQMSASSDSQSGVQQASSEDHAELDALQSSLTNTLVFPTDFKTVPEFTLVGVDGNPVDQTMFDGQWTTAFFGFTHCPDVCPITLSVMKEVVQALENDSAEPMQVAFISVDPKRDTPEIMKNYVNFFDPEFIGITGDLANIHELTRHLGIVASYTANKEDPENYTVDHTASMLLIDPERRVRAKFNAPHEAETILADYLKLRATL